MKMEKSGEAKKGEKRFGRSLVLFCLLFVQHGIVSGKQRRFIPRSRDPNGQTQFHAHRMDDLFL